MDERAMMDIYTLPLSMTLPVWFFGGLLLGYTYFLAVRETANLIVGHGHPLLGLALTMGRLAALGGGLYLAALAGAFGLMGMLAGVLSGKALMFRQTKSAGT